MVDLPQQIVDEDGAPQVGLGVVQETQLLEGEAQDAAALLTAYQVLRDRKTKIDGGIEKGREMRQKESEIEILLLRCHSQHPLY